MDITFKHQKAQLLNLFDTKSKTNFQKHLLEN